MGFWIATADASGTRITDSDLLLQPGPTRVEYVQEPAGGYIDTADGSVVHQQPNRDGRRRTWEWVGYPDHQVGYNRVWPVLLSLRSRYRAEGGLSPYVFLKEDVTGGIRRRLQLLGASGSGSGNTFTDGSATWTASALVGGFVIVAGQARAIIANTTTTLTVDDPFVGTPSGSYVINYFAADWFRARVLEASRIANDDGRALVYRSTRIVFVIDDANSADLLG